MGSSSDGQASLAKDTERIKQQPDVIPEAEFDWNRAGLKNPLERDGKTQRCFLNFQD
jgi:hypothetical protein